MGGIYEVLLGDGLRFMIYIPSFIKIGSGISRSEGGVHRQHGDLISLL
jgi:hypothetical protein